MKILTTKDLKKVGWLIDTRDKVIKPVFSATKSNVRIGESTIPTISFFDTHIKNYEVPTESQLEEIMTQRVSEFFEEHSGEIRGLFNDKYYKNGGWNGMMDSITEVQKRYPSQSNLIDFDYVNLENLIKKFL